MALKAIKLPAKGGGGHKQKVYTFNIGNMSGDEESAGDYAVYYTPFPVHATKADLYVKTTTTRTGITVTLVGNPSVTLHNDVYERTVTINLPDIAVDTTATGLQVRTWSYQTPGRAYIDGTSYVKVYADD